MLLCFFFKQKTAYEMRISDWSSDVCSSDLDIADDHGEHRDEDEEPERDAPNIGAPDVRVQQEAAERGRVEDQRGDARHQHHIALAMMIDKAAELDAEHRRQHEIDARDTPRREHRLGFEKRTDEQRETN